MDQELMDVPEEVREDIEKRPNVVGTATGKRREDGQATDEDAVLVLVTEKLPEDALSRQDLVPETVTIDSKEYRTDVVEVGHLNAQQAGQESGEIGGEERQSAEEARRGGEEARRGGEEAQRSGGQRVVGRTREREERLREASTPVAEHVPELRNRKRRLRPAPAGVSVGHEEITAGTLGSPPLETVDGTVVFLTNAHVAAPIDEASTGDSIVQPGPTDGGTGADTIGRLVEWTAIEREGANRSDSALVEIDDESVAADVLALGDFAGWAEPEVGVEYVKSGRTTGVTSGELLARNARVRVGGYYPDEATVFEGIDVFGPMSAGGDSGSLIGHQRTDGFYATDLLFGGSDRVTLGIPMTVVQEFHGSLSPADGRVGPTDSGPDGEFREQVRRRLAGRFGADSVTSDGDDRTPGFQVDSWPVSLSVVIADDRESALDSVGHAFTGVEDETIPVVVYPAEAGDRPLFGGYGVPVIPVHPP
jgi:hypothetical protein